MKLVNLPNSAPEQCTLMYKCVSLHSLEESDGMSFTHREVPLKYSLGHLCRNFMLDALMMCESGQCVRFLAELTMDQQTISIPSTLTADHIRSWLTALHFHHIPQLESVEAIMVSWNSFLFTSWRSHFVNIGSSLGLVFWRCLINMSK